LNAQFENCQFIDCTFAKISASAEHLHFNKSSISPSKFLGALVTNLNELPNKVEKKYQEYRLDIAKAKIAAGIFLSVRDEPELDQLFEANKCYEIALHYKRVIEAYWKEDTGRLVKRGGFSRWIVHPWRKSELFIVKTAGFFTNWGRSPIKSVWFLAGAIILFSGIYTLFFAEPLSCAVLRALDCTFVFGYTKYSAGGLAENWMMFLNTFAGFCWYGLLIPALSRRLFR
jgi:hypothetical protein